MSLSACLSAVRSAPLVLEDTVTCNLQALAGYVANSITPASAFDGNSDKASWTNGFTATAASPSADTTTVLADLLAIIAGVLGSSVDPDQPLMGVR